MKWVHTLVFTLVLLDSFSFSWSCFFPHWVVKSVTHQVSVQSCYPFPVTPQNVLKSMNAFRFHFELTSTSMTWTSISMFIINIYKKLTFSFAGSLPRFHIINRSVKCSSKNFHSFHRSSTCRSAQLSRAGDATRRTRQTTAANSQQAINT